VPFELIRPGTHFDFIGKRRITITLSIALLLAGLVAGLVNGVKLGIDFEGGTEMQVLFDESVAADESAIRSVVKACGIVEPSVVRYGETDAKEFLIRFHLGEAAVEEGEGCTLLAEQKTALNQARQSGGGGGEAGEKGETIDKLAFAMENSIGSLTVQRVEFVGPRVGAELRAAGVKSLLVACALILAYIAFRFSTRFAPGAIVALVHDVGITAGIFVIFGMEFDLRVLAALLAIVGYSLNDTIIIYDRIRENMELRTKFDLVDVLNQSINQTLSRTVLTSGTTMAAVMALWILGGEIIRPFSIAMAIGIIVGTYSSIFIAAPTLLFLETRFAARGGAAGGSDRSGEAHREATSGASGPGSGKSRSQRKKSRQV
jgi:preprotein translocase subunit SecF